MTAYPCTGEEVTSSAAMIERILAHYASFGPIINRTGGVSAKSSGWRFNVRASSTEPLLRLNIEARGDKILVGKRVADLAARRVGSLS